MISANGSRRVTTSMRKPKGWMVAMPVTMSLDSNEAVTPSAENTSTGPTVSTARYSPTRCDRARDCSTRQITLKLASTFWIIDSAA